MTVYPLDKLQLNKPETGWKSALRFAALPALVIAVSALLFGAVNAALPALAEMRIQSAVNALSQDRLTPQRHQAQVEIENAGEAAVPALIVALRSENPVLRRNAADLMGYIASPLGQAALQDTLLNDRAPLVRRNAARALGEVQNLASWNDLNQATVLDTSKAVRQTAADSIARIRTRLAQTAGVNEQDLSAFAAAPADSNQAYLTTRRDLISTRDGGKTWTTTANALPSLVTMLAVSRDNPQMLYANVEGLGLFQSADAGATWSPINTGLGVMPGARYSVTAIAMDTTNPQRLFISTGVWLGTSHLEFFSTGVMQSVDGGSTWQSYQKNANAAPITQLAIKGNRLYALAGNQVFIYPVL